MSKLTHKIKILIADDKQDICNSLAETLLIEATKYDLTEDDFDIHKAFTEHAYEHGCQDIVNGFVPDICVFDLIFNGYSGIDLYNFMSMKITNKKIDLCLYTGVEKKFEKRKEAEVLASSSGGSVIVVAKPKITEILQWFGKILEKKYGLEKIITENDPFDLL